MLQIATNILWLHVLVHILIKHLDVIIMEVDWLVYTLLQYMIRELTQACGNAKLGHAKDVHISFRAWYGGQEYTYNIFPPVHSQ